MAKKARDLKPLVVVDKSDVDIERLNALLEILKEQEEQIEQLQRLAGRCECMNCVVIGI